MELQTLYLRQTEPTVNVREKKRRTEPDQFWYIHGQQASSYSCYAQKQINRKIAEFFLICYNTLFE